MYCAGAENAAKHFAVKFCQISQGTKSLLTSVDVGCVHMLINNARVRRGLRALWCYNELGLTNPSVFF